MMDPEAPRERARRDGGQRLFARRLSLLAAVVIILAQAACGRSCLRPAQQHYFSGMKAFNQRNYKQALTEYDQAIKLDPYQPAYYKARGWTYELLSQDDKALTDFDQALRLKPDYAEALLHRGRVYLRKDDYRRAVADFSQAIKLNQEAESYFLRGQAYARMDQFEAAISDYSQAIKLEPKSYSSYEQRASVYANLGMYQQALADHDKAIELNPELWMAYNDKAWILATCPAAEIRDGKQAISLAKQANDRTDWKVSGYLDTLAAAYAETGQFDQAVKWQQQALAKLPQEQEPLRPMLEEHLQLYRQNQPYRESPEKMKQNRQSLKPAP
jgi:tetratricopeptide (TPR) repeat protein